MTTQAPHLSGSAPGGVPATVVTRFAPLPTGYLHVGGVRTALFNWLLARHHGGKFLLRVEDTDLARSTEQAALQLLEDLRWLGLHWDNAELVYQSRRLPVYNAIIDDLIARGLAYKAYETSDELAAGRAEADRKKQTFRYQRPKLTDEQVRRYEAEGRPHTVRFAMPVKDYSFDDLVLGPGKGYAAAEVQDFIIRKEDGMPTYHFAVVVDDAEMGVTLVLRGQEHTLNTGRHMALQERVGYPRPAYGHLPIIMNLDGSKMGKRDRDKKIRQSCREWTKRTRQEADHIAGAAGVDPSRFRDWLGDSQKQLDLSEQAAVMQVIGLKESDLPEILVHDFRKNGYLPEGLLNFLALLGWSPGGDRERMTVDEMVRLFDVQDINKGNAKFDRAKLSAFNTEAAAAATPDRLVSAMKDYLAVNPDSPLDAADEATLGKLLHMKKGFRVLRDVDESTRLFFTPDERIAYDRDAVEKVLTKGDGQGLAVLREVREVLAGVNSWSAASLEGAVKGYGERKGLGLGKVAQPVRVAISGTTVSPPIFESLEFLGRERTLRRIDRCLAALPG